MSHKEILYFERHVRQSRDSKMSETHNIGAILFVLGLFFMAIGIGVSIIVRAGAHPYASQGALMFIIGLIILVAAFIIVRITKRTEE